MRELVNDASIDKINRPPGRLIGGNGGTLPEPTTDHSRLGRFLRGVHALTDGACEIVDVGLGERKCVERFIRVPWYIHREHYPNSRWVPPLLMDRRRYLDPDKNPLFEHATCRLWLARSGGRDVGRIAAIDDGDFEKFYGERVGYFGMFECPDNLAIAQELVQRACNWLRLRGGKRVIGPFDFSTHYETGVLVDTFDRDPGMGMPYNPPYYEKLLRGCGLEKVKDLWNWGYDLRKPIPERVVRIAERTRKRDRIRLRRLDFRNWEAEAMRTREVYNEAWQCNWGFVPVREKEYHHIAAELRTVLHPSLALIAEVDGRPVGIALTLMNVNPILRKLDGRLFPTGFLRLIWDLKIRRKVDSGRLLMLGVRSSHRRRGVDSLLFVETHSAAAKLGWWGGDIGWTLEDNNPVNRALAAMGATRVSTYRVFGREL